MRVMIAARFVCCRFTEKRPVTLAPRSFIQVLLALSRARAARVNRGSGSGLLAWDRARALRIHSRNNVVLHEFAHQLDSEDGEADGTHF
jgi:hypothetical protein